ncbi:RHS repeat domain-containing protein [Amphritea pacifica]|uniref:RHS repeat domain-containing protein n=1 Tax=Amphritea pacifica TaxID=2811233 RepID=UPI0019659B76|nr:RHS repeat-associated core domain-containing protein [Amphritea pacifica]MBN1009188.1 RHS repeat-associated core domain-containing protein [Amphritea pacifica]
MEYACPFIALIWNMPVPLLNFKYGPDRSRYLKTESNGNKTIYIGKLYERITNSNTPQMITHKQFIYAGGSLVAIHSSGLDSLGAVKAPQTRYLHKDNLGSVDTITDAVGNIVDRMSFDPFGGRRQNNWREATAGVNLIPVLTNRGFTGHEHLDDVGLIHMNGRVYDAALGRFLSADPTMQFPYSTQGFNRYSYTHNNPLKYTDPSGYVLGGFIGQNIVKLGHSITSFAGDVLRAFASVPIINGLVQAVGCYIANAACPQFLAMYNSATTYAVTGNVGLALRSGLVTLASSAAAQWVGTTFDFNTVPVANVIGNGVVGGVMSKIQGGTFKDGFIASAFAASLKNVNKDIWGTKLENRPYRVLTAAAIGGTASVLGGGKFSNGAASAAFTQMFNAENSYNEQTEGNTGLKVSLDWTFKVGKFTFGINQDGLVLFGAENGGLSVDSNGTASAGNVNLTEGSAKICSSGSVAVCAGQNNGDATMSVKIRHKSGVTVEVEGKDPLNPENGMLNGKLGLGPAHARMCAAGLANDC